MKCVYTQLYELIHLCTKLWIMRGIVTSFLIVLISLSAFAQAEHVILISIDGLRPEFYQDSGWPATNIQHLAEEGATADFVRGVFPSVTYPSHTTIITGAMPAKHGIYYNSPFEPGGQTGRWYWEEELIQQKTLWDAAREKGLTTANVSWPVSVGAPVDYNLPEVWTLDRDADQYAYAKSLATDGLPEELESKASGEITDATYSMDWTARDVRAGFMAVHMIEKYKPNLFTIHLVTLDHFQHEEGRDGLQVRRSLQAVDYAVGQIKDACERAGILDKTAIIVTGDHGFVDIHTTVQPNAWLVKAGLMEPRRDRGDWKAAFHTSGAAAFLQLKDPNDKKTLQKVRQILNDLPEDRKKLFRVVDRDELDAIGADPSAPLALTPEEGINLSSWASNEDLRAASGGQHGFFPDFDDIHTGFIGYGAGFRKGAVARQIGLEDIAPLIIKLLDLDLEVPDGTLYPGLLSNK